MFKVPRLHVLVTSAQSCRVVCLRATVPLDFGVSHRPLPRQISDFSEFGGYTVLPEGLSTDIECRMTKTRIFYWRLVT